MSVPCKVHIRRVSTGEVRIHEMASGWFSEQEHPEYIWEEGNFSCDCNRGDFFRDVKGEPEQDDPCGNHLYVVDKIEIEDGTVVYSEEAEKP